MLFNETVLVTGVRENGRRVYVADLPCRVVDNGIAEPFDSHSSSSKRRELMFFVKASDWSAICFTPPQTGDIITRGVARFAVRRVNDLCEDIMTLEAVSC